MSSSRSSTVTNSPLRLLICTRLPFSVRLTSCMITGFEQVGLVAQRLVGRLHAGDVAVMVGAPDVDQPLEPARVLVGVVGDVGREVGVLAARAAQHAVLVVAEVGRAQPQRAVVLVAVAAGRQRLESAARNGRRAACARRTRCRSRRPCVRASRGFVRSSGRCPASRARRRSARPPRRSRRRSGRCSRPCSRLRAPARRVPGRRSKRRSGRPDCRSR